MALLHVSRHAATPASWIAVAVAVCCAAPTPAPAVTPREADRQLEQRLDQARREAEQHPKDREARLRYAKLLHLKGSLGDARAAKRAQAMFESLRQTHGDDPLLLAYAGSAKMLQAKRTWLVWKKGDLVEAGGDLLNRALAEARATPEPDELEVRFLRAVSADKLPDWMGQRELVTSEFAALAERVPDAVEQGRLSPYQAASTLYHRGRDLIDAGRGNEARPLLQRAIDLAPDSHAALHAQEALARLD